MPIRRSIGSIGIVLKPLSESLLKFCLECCRLPAFGVGQVLFIAMLFSLISCAPDNLPASLRKDKAIGEFLAIALDPESDASTRFVALEPIISQAREKGEIAWLISLLGKTLEKNPGDPYGAYYLMAMAEGENTNESRTLALDYLKRLVRNYPDLQMAGQSLHFLALKEIAVRTDNPQEAIAARLDMKRRFPDRIEAGRNLYFLAEEYRKTGEWTAMYNTYKDYLNAPDTTIPGIPEARSSVMENLTFHASRKTWIMPSLEELVETIKYAIQTQNAPLLTRLQSDNFFLMHWTQDTSDSFTHIPMNLGGFLTHRIRYRNELDSYSNNREAFLWTSGWTWKIPIWYLYFRKIDYPANPDINGQWEWAGIYIGERL